MDTDCYYPMHCPLAIAILMNVGWYPLNVCERALMASLLALMVLIPTVGCLSESHDDETPPDVVNPTIRTSEARIQQYDALKNLWNVSFKILGLKDLQNGTGWGRVWLTVEKSLETHVGTYYDIRPFNGTLSSGIECWYQKDGNAGNATIEVGDVVIVTGLHDTNARSKISCYLKSGMYIIFTKSLGPVFVKFEFISSKPNRSSGNSKWDVTFSINRIEPDTLTVFLSDVFVRLEDGNDTVGTSDFGLRLSPSSRPYETNAYYLTGVERPLVIVERDRILITNIVKDLMDGWMFLIFEDSPIGCGRLTS